MKLIQVHWRRGLCFFKQLEEQIKEAVDRFAVHQQVKVLFDKKAENSKLGIVSYLGTKRENQKECTTSLTLYGEALSQFTRL